MAQKFHNRKLYKEMKTLNEPVIGWIWYDKLV